MPPRQFDVFVNPAPRVRREYPFVVVIQSDQIDTGRPRVVAPLTVVDRGSTTGLSRRLAPVVSMEGRDYAVLVPRLATVDAAFLSRSVASLEPERDAILSAVDLLIFGI